MSKDSFVTLADQFCKLAILPQAEHLLEGYAVEIDGVDFYLSYQEELDNLIIHADFGAPPAALRLAAYEALLEVNMAMYGTHPPVFMLSPAKQVALAYYYHLPEIDARKLLNLCLGVASRANEWRRHYFLG
jgi:hypothetical protein